MNKLYVGNLPPNTTEYSLQNLFTQHNLPFVHISVRNGSNFAFVDCDDQSAADRAVDCLNGKCF